MELGAGDEARRRSGQTKRARSRQALLAAAADVFRRGWAQARVDDIAQAAGVRTSTAYNHFPGGKQELIGHVYAPLVDPLVEAAEADVTAGVDPLQAVERHITAAANVARQELALTISLIAAVTDQIVRVGRPPVPDPSDVRMLVRWTTSLTLLVAYGQEQRIFRDFPAAEDVSSHHINAMLQRVISRREESAEETAAIVLSQLVPSLRTGAPAKVRVPKMRTMLPAPRT
jgi:AcrR family transcriptional regulator